MGVLIRVGRLSGYLLQQYYDGGRLRGEKIDNGAATYYLRSSVLGGQVVAEIYSSGALQRGYVYLGGELLAVQQNNQVSWIHQEPMAKSKRVTNASGNTISTVEPDPFGGNTNRNSNDAFQPHKFTTYERDLNASDEAMQRRYNRWWSRFDQPDPYDSSYDLTNPQSFNRYAYTQNDPVNFVDPTGLEMGDCTAEFNATGQCTIGGGNLPIDDPGMFSFVVNSRFGGFGGGGGGSHGGGGAGHETGHTDPQKPVPQPHPTPAPRRNNQQDGFDDCAKHAWRHFRLGYLRDSMEGVGGGALVAGGIYVGLRGIPGAGVTGGIGVRAAIALGFSHGLEAPIHVAQAGVLAGLPLAALGSMMIIHSIKNSETNHSTLDAALQDCKNRFPNANHSLSFLNF